MQRGAEPYDRVIKQSPKTLKLYQALAVLLRSRGAFTLFKTLKPRGNEENQERKENT